MRLDFFRHALGNLSGDRLMILLALLLGIGGQLFVWLIPDPRAGLADKAPLLLPQDWQGSYAYRERAIGGEAPWMERREFSTSLALNNDPHTNAEIQQIGVWYADPLESAAAWDRSTKEHQATYGEPPTEANKAGSNQPASRLFCIKRETPTSPGDCTYFAYWEHWFTEVHFWSQYEEDLDLEEMQRVTARVDELLMSAPAEPCYGNLCTNSPEDKSYP